MDKLKVGDKVRYYFYVGPAIPRRVQYGVIIYIYRSVLYPNENLYHALRDDKSFIDSGHRKEFTIVN